MRKKHSKQFKAKVALEALREEEPIQNIAQKHNIHPNMVTKWKKQLIDEAALLFERPNKKPGPSPMETQRDELFMQIGEMKVENEFLKKKYRQLYGTEPDLSSLHLRD
jgi:transposase-like protein